MRQPGIYLIAATTLALAGSACRNANAPDGTGVVIRTDRTAYTARYLEGEGPSLRYAFTAVVRVENRGSRIVYLNRCNGPTSFPIYGVELVNPEWGMESAYGIGGGCGLLDSGTAPATGEPYFELRPGESRTDELLIQGPAAWSTAGMPLGELTGRMRLFNSIRLCPAGEECPEPTRAASNSFQVTVEERD